MMTRFLVAGGIKTDIVTRHFSYVNGNVKQSAKLDPVCDNMKTRKWQKRIST